MAKNDTLNDIQNLQQSSIIVSEIPTKNLVEVSIRGELGDVSEHAQQINIISDLSQTYDTIHVYINSPGGSLTTCIDLMSAIKKYGIITTFAIGMAASAGLILWSIGHIRVVDEYTILMAHRESYGSYGKTNEHLAMAQVSNKVYERLYKETVDVFLTKKERELSQSSEVWIDALDIIKRGHAISMADYLTPKKQISIENVYVVNDSRGVNKYIFIDEFDAFVNVGELKPFIKDGKLEVISDMNDYISGMDNEILYIDISEEQTNETNLEEV